MLSSFLPCVKVQESTPLHDPPMLNPKGRPCHVASNRCIREPCARWRGSEMIFYECWCADGSEQAAKCGWPNRCSVCQQGSNCLLEVASVTSHDASEPIKFSGEFLTIYRVSG